MDTRSCSAEPLGHHLFAQKNARAGSTLRLSTGASAITLNRRGPNSRRTLAQPPRASKTLEASKALEESPAPLENSVSMVLFGGLELVAAGALFGGGCAVCRDPPEARERRRRSRAVWKSTSGSGAPDNSSLSHFSAMTRPPWQRTWLRRAVRNRHRHAIEQVSRRWRGGRRDDLARTRREILIST